MNNFNSIDVSIESRIATVIINRPKALNALNSEVFNDLDTCFGEYLRKETILGVIIKGAGEKAFVAGADIKEFAELTQQTATELSRRGQLVFDKIESFPKPVIAVVHGFALGGGCELALACHMRIAEENAKFGLPELNLGLIPGYGGTQRLPRIIGHAKAIEYTLTSSIIDAQTAVSLGLANYVVPQGEGEACATKILKKVASKAPLAVTAALKLIQSSSNNKEENLFVKESQIFGEIMLTEDAKEGTSAFVEKRSPNFSGK